jgi:hypothetical protein
MARDAGVCEEGGRDREKEREGGRERPSNLGCHAPAADWDTGRAERWAESAEVMALIPSASSRSGPASFLCSAALPETRSSMRCDNILKVSALEHLLHKVTM